MNTEQAKTVLGGVSASALFMIVTPSNAGTCMEPVHAYSAYENSCNPQYEISLKVKAFLELPEDQQQKLLEGNVRLCAYYNEFNKKLQEAAHRDLKVTKISCGLDAGIQVELTENGRPVRHHLALEKGTGKLRSAVKEEEFRNPQGVLTLHFFEKDGRTKLSAATIRSLASIERKLPTSEFADLIHQNNSKGVARAIANFHAAQLYSSGVIDC